MAQTNAPRLSEAARRVHAPSGIVSSGWPAVEAKCADLGITFRWWQSSIGRLTLAKRDDGMYASTIGGVGLSIPRQVGKTFLVAGIMFALCLLRPGFTVLWTAHRLKTAEETFGKLQVFARRRKIAPHVRQVKTGSGEQQIIFRNGSRILFGARERGFGRGFDEVDALVFDEGQILTDSALDDMIPATNQSRQPEGALLLFMGTPPRPQDPGEVFERMRSDADAGDEDTAWVEFGADPGYRPTPLPAPLDDADWGQITAANPSFPEDTSRTAVLRMRKKLGDESFLREGCGIWGVKASEALPNWANLADPAAERGASPAFGVAVAPDREWAAVAVAWTRSDGRQHVEMAAYRRDAGWVSEEVARLRSTWGHRPVFADLGGHELVPDATSQTGTDEARAQETLADALKAGTLTHRDDPALNIAVSAARWKARGDVQVLDRRATTDITPIRAAALALRGALTVEDHQFLVIR